MRYCYTCDAPITDAKRKSKIYCCNACKVAAWQAKQKEKPVRPVNRVKREMLADCKVIGGISPQAEDYLVKLVAMAHPDNANLAINAVFEAMRSLGKNYNHQKGTWDE